MSNTNETLDALHHLITHRPKWMTHAACNGNPGLWDDDHPNLTNYAKTVCATCPVRQQCHDYADTHEPDRFGVIYGGLTGNERARLRRSREMPQRDAA